jgi:hypothetical protein
MTHHPPSRPASVVSTGLTAEALHMQEQSFHGPPPDLHDKVADFLGAIEAPDDARGAIPVLHDRLEERTPPAAPAEVGQPVYPPGQPLPLQSRSGNQHPKVSCYFLVSGANSSQPIAPLKKKTVVKPFNFSSRLERRANKEPQTVFEDKVVSWQKAESAASQSQAAVVPRPRVLSNPTLAPATQTQIARDRVIKPVGANVDKKRKREETASKVAVKEFRFATDKRVRRV